MISGLIFFKCFYGYFFRGILLRRMLEMGQKLIPQGRNLKATMRHSENALAGGQKFQRRVTSDFPQIVNESLCLELFFTMLLRAGDWLLVGSIDLPVPQPLLPQSYFCCKSFPRAPAQQQLYNPSFSGIPPAMQEFCCSLQVPNQQFKKLSI